MKLIELLTAIGVSDDSCEKIQICQPGSDWENYDTFQCWFKVVETILRFGSKLSFGNRNGCDQS